MIMNTYIIKWSRSFLFTYTIIRHHLSSSFLIISEHLYLSNESEDIVHLIFIENVVNPSSLQHQHLVSEYTFYVLYTTSDNPLPLSLSYNIR